MTKKKTAVGSSKTIARLKAKKVTTKAQQKAPMLQAMVWYKEEHYNTLLELFDDAQLLPKTSQDWLQRAEEKKDEVQASGNKVIKVFIDPEIFPAWCKEKNLKMDANARSQLAIEVAQAQSFAL